MVRFTKGDYSAPICAPLRAMQTLPDSSLLTSKEKEGLCEIPWVRESQLGTQEVDHVDVVVDVSKAASTALGQLDLAVDTLQNRIGNVRVHKVNDP
jgi:hypothetical protein